jgi:splicing factor 3A subunit 1
LLQHPIALKVQLPTDGSKPEWKLNGALVTVPDLMVTVLVSTLRERITKVIESSVPHSRIRLHQDGKELRNANTIASYNLEDGDVVVFSVRDQKKK